MFSNDASSVLVLGDINTDLTLTVSALPGRGDDVAAHAVHWGSGGAALNMAVMFARLGANTKLFGRVGHDPAATIVLQIAREAGVELSAVQYDPHVATGICVSTVEPDAERTFVTYRGANLFLTADETARQAIAGCRLLAVTAYALLEPQQRTTALTIIHRASEHGIPIVLDLCLPAVRTCTQLIKDLLPELWLLTMNEAELKTLLPDLALAAAIDLLLRAGTPRLAIKRGALGCSVASSTERLDLLPPHVEPVDTNGCGDAFTAGFAWASLQQAGLGVCAALGNLLGALTATRPGSADALPLREEMFQHADSRLRYLLTVE